MFNKIYLNKMDVTAQIMGVIFKIASSGNLWMFSLDNRSKRQLKVMIKEIRASDSEALRLAKLIS